MVPNHHFPRSNHSWEEGFTPNGRGFVSDGGFGPGGRFSTGVVGARQGYQPHCVGLFPGAEDSSAHGGSIGRARGSVRGGQQEERSLPRGGAFRSAVHELKQESRTNAGAGSGEGSVRGGSANRSFASMYAELRDAELGAAGDRQSLRRTSSAAYTDDGAGDLGS